MPSEYRQKNLKYMAASYNEDTLFGEYRKPELKKAKVQAEITDNINENKFDTNSELS